MDDFEDLRRMAVISGMDPCTLLQLPVLPHFDGANFSDTFMKELEQDHVGVIKTSVKPSADIQLDLRNKAKPGEVAIIDVKSKNKMVPNLSSKLNVEITEINGNSGCDEVPFEILRCGETGDQTEIRVRVGGAGQYKVEVMLYQENLRNSPIIIEVPEEQEVSQRDKETARNSSSTSAALKRSMLQKKAFEVMSKKEKSKESSHIKFPDLVSNGRVIKTVQMKIDSAWSQRRSFKTEATLDGPIGLCVLDTERVAVASTVEDKVKIFTMEGKFVQLLLPKVPFKRPSDMLRLAGEDIFAVRDNLAIQFFRLTGQSQYHSSLDSPYITKCFGLAQDSQGLLITINENKYLGRRKKDKMMLDPELVTKPGGIDLLFFNWRTSQLVRKFSLTDRGLIPTTDLTRSKCRFLYQDQGTIIVADNGLNRLYIISHNETDFKTVEGRGGDSFDDPGGVVTDGQGNLLMADSKKHRLCVINKEGEVVGQLRLMPQVERPSGLHYDKISGELFVLNLHGSQALVKYCLANR